MSRYFGLFFLVALSAGCGANSIDTLSAAELNGTWAGATVNDRADVARRQPTRASQCHLNVTTHVNTAKVVGTYSTFACEGSPIELVARR